MHIPQGISYNPIQFVLQGVKSLTAESFASSEASDPQADSGGHDGGLHPPPRDAAQRSTGDGGAAPALGVFTSPQ